MQSNKDTRVNNNESTVRMDPLLRTSQDHAVNRKLLSPALPGYTGFVPGQRLSGLGQSYGKKTRDNLIAFWSRHTYSKTSDGFPSQAVQRKFQRSRSLNESRIYTTRGLIPHYTGFVPGMTFKVGGTYGNITKEIGQDREMPK